MRSRRSSRWRLALAVIGLAAVLRAPSLFHQLYDVDEAAIATQGIVVRGGGTLYVDAVDRKPPVVPLLYGWVFKVTGSNDLRPLHALATAGLATCGLLAAADAARSERAGRRHIGAAEAHLEAGTATATAPPDIATPPADPSTRSAWWAAGLVTTGLVIFFPVDAQAANFAHFAVVPGTVAIVAARRGTARSAVVAGIAVGVAMLCRQTWLLGVAPAMVGAALSAPRRWHALLVPVGAVLPVAAIAAVVPFGAFVHWTFTGNSSFVLTDTTLAGAVSRGIASTAIFAVGHVTVCWLLAVRGRDDAGFLRTRWRGRDRVLDAARDIDLDLWLWLATGLVAAAIGYRFYGHYWLQVVPPAGLLVAPVAARLTPEREHVARFGVLAPTAVAVAVAFTPGTIRPIVQADDLVAYVQAHTGPHQPVMLWGNLPQVVWKADRPLGGGLVHMDFVTGLSGGREPGLETIADATPGAEDVVVDRLEADPPELILDTSTADIHGYGTYPISAFPRIQAVLDRSYEPVDVVDGVTVYRRTAH